MSCPGRLTPGKEPQYPPNVRIGGLKSLSGSFGEEKNFLPPVGVRTPNRPARSLVAIQTELSPTMMIMTTII